MELLQGVKQGAYERYKTSPQRKGDPFSESTERVEAEVQQLESLLAEDLPPAAETPRLAPEVDAEVGDGMAETEALQRQTPGVATGQEQHFRADVDQDSPQISRPTISELRASLVTSLSSYRNLYQGTSPEE